MRGDITSLLLYLPLCISLHLPTMSTNAQDIAQARVKTMAVALQAMPLMYANLLTFLRTSLRINDLRSRSYYHAGECRGLRWSLSELVLQWLDLHITSNDFVERFGDSPMLLLLAAIAEEIDRIHGAVIALTRLIVTLFRNDQRDPAVARLVSA